MVCLNPHLRQNYSIFMRNFKQNQHKLSNNHVQFSNQTSFVNLNPLARNSGSTPASTIYFIYSHGPAHMGPIWNLAALPIWVTYRLLAGVFDKVSKIIFFKLLVPYRSETVSGDYI